MQHRDRGDIGNVLPTALQHGPVGNLHIEQHRIEALATETP